MCEACRARCPECGSKSTVFAGRTITDDAIGTEMHCMECMFPFVYSDDDDVLR